MPNVMLEDLLSCAALGPEAGFANLNFLIGVLAFMSTMENHLKWLLVLLALDCGFCLQVTSTHAVIRGASFCWRTLVGVAAL